MCGDQAHPATPQSRTEAGNGTAGGAGVGKAVVAAAWGGVVNIVSWEGAGDVRTL